MRFSSQNSFTPRFLTKGGCKTRQPRHRFTIILLAADLLRARRGSGCSRWGCDAHLDLLGLGFLTLGNHQRQDTILVIGLDAVGVYRVGQRKAPAKRAVRALNTQVVVFVHLLLE